MLSMHVNRHFGAFVRILECTRLLICLFYKAVFILQQYREDNGIYTFIVCFVLFLNVRNRMSSNLRDFMLIDWTNITISVECKNKKTDESPRTRCQ